jgi:hypothetical protein
MMIDDDEDNQSLEEEMFIEAQKVESLIDCSS